MKSDVTLICARCGSWKMLCDVEASTPIELYRLAKSVGWELRLNMEIFCSFCKREEELKWIPKPGRK